MSNLAKNIMGGNGEASRANEGEGGDKRTVEG